MSEHDSVSLQPDTWGDVDRYVEALLTEVREQRMLVLTEAFVFRERQAAGLLALPGLVLEEAGRIIARLREFVPELLPDQLVVLLAWTVMGPHGIDVGVRDLRWTREQATWSGTLHLAIEAGEPVEVRRPLALDGLIEHEITTMFDGVTPTGLLNLTDLVDDEGFFVHPDGPLARLASPCEWHHHA